jgi:hypothetical protein
MISVQNPLQQLNGNNLILKSINETNAVSTCLLQYRFNQRISI